MSIEFLDCLKRERDIAIKAVSSGGKMAFRLIPPLKHVDKKVVGFWLSTWNHEYSHHFMVPFVQENWDLAYQFENNQCRQKEIEVNYREMAMNKRH